MKVTLLNDQDLAALKLLHPGEKIHSLEEHALQALAELCRDPGRIPRVLPRKITKNLGRVTVQRDGEVKKTHGLLMEWIEGSTLGGWNQDRNLAERVGIARALIAGLAEVHDRQVAMGDLKLSNIMVTSNGEVRLVDWGSLCWAPPITEKNWSASGQRETASFLGTTPGFSEDRLPGGTGCRCQEADIYALGNVLTALFAGGGDGGPTAVRDPHGTNQQDLRPVQLLSATELQELFRDLGRQQSRTLSALVLEMVSQGSAAKAHERPDIAEVARRYDALFCGHTQSARSRLPQEVRDHSLGSLPGRRWSLVAAFVLAVIAVLVATLCGRASFPPPVVNPTDPVYPEIGDLLTARGEDPLLKNGGAWIDVTIAGVTQRFRWISPGRFLMGSPSEEVGRDGDETQHAVTLSRGFWLGDTEVTQGLWKGVMGWNPSCFGDVPDRPVEQVSWDDCQEFIARLNKLAPGLNTRLPTEAEWEWACRAGKVSAYSDGSACLNPGGRDPNLDVLGWYNDNSDSVAHGVKQKRRNDWGLYDMHGNVWEWCQDLYGEYGQAAVTDPLGRGVTYRVARGGTWGYDARACRSANRYDVIPATRASRVGLRLAASVPPPGSH